MDRTSHACPSYMKKQQVGISELSNFKDVVFGSRISESNLQITLCRLRGGSHLEEHK